MRLKFHGDNVVASAGTRDEIPRRVSAAQIQSENAKFWNQQPALQGEPAATVPESEHFNLPERVTIGELQAANTIPGAWRNALSSDRVGRRIAVFGSGVDVAIRNGGRAYHLDAQIPRGQKVLTLPANAYVIEQRDDGDGGIYVIWSFEKPSDPGASERETAIAKLESELAREGTTHSTTDMRLVADTSSHRDVERIRALQRRLTSHDWRSHAKW